MVCLGNICRSPMAEGILRSEITKRKLTHVVDSAGTGNWHSGEAPDRRAIATAKNLVSIFLNLLRVRLIEVIWKVSIKFL